MLSVDCWFDFDLFFLPGDLQGLLAGWGLSTVTSTWWMKQHKMWLDGYRTSGLIDFKCCLLSHTMDHMGTFSVPPTKYNLLDNRGIFGNPTCYKKCNTSKHRSKLSCSFGEIRFKPALVERIITFERLTDWYEILHAVILASISGQVRRIYWK